MDSAKTTVSCKMGQMSPPRADGDTILVDARDGELVFEKAGAVEPAAA